MKKYLLMTFVLGVVALSGRTMNSLIDNYDNEKFNMETSIDQTSDYLSIVHHDDGSVALYFNIEDDKILALGEEMNRICEEAYMNGYNWEAFMNYYLAEKAPDILKDMETDPEAGTYVAYYEEGAANEDKVKCLASIIVSLIDDKQEIFKLLREAGDKIEWD